MSELTVTSNDLSLVKQNHQRRYMKIQLVNREWQTVCVIKGRLITANCNIESGEDIRRSANIVIKTESQFIKMPYHNISIDLQRDISFSYYIRLWAGIEDNDTLKISWYNQGLFVINQSGYNFDASTNTLSLSLTDLMCDLTGDRAGILHAYTVLVKNQQRIDDVMINVLELAGFKQHNITPICPLSGMNTVNFFVPSEEDYKIPYDIDFPVGVSAYDILAKLVSLYPYYEMGFDVDGTFFCRKKLLSQDDSWVVIDSDGLRNLTISEDTTMDWFSVKNYIEVWGKDGLYYGEAKDENPESPFQVSSTAPFRKVITGSEDGVDTNTICDKYKDTELAESLFKEQASCENIISDLSAIKNPTDSQRRQLQGARAQLEEVKKKMVANIALHGNELAQEWAEQKLYEHSRVYDSITITTICMPFLNDADFKVSYRSKIDNIVHTYMVTSISHDYIAGTSTLTLTRFYNSMCSNLWDMLDVPIVSSYAIIDSELVVNIQPVEHAESYNLFVDGSKVTTSTGTTLSYTFSDWQEGTHSFIVQASAPYYRSNISNSYTIEYTVATLIITDTGDTFITDSGDTIITDEED